jgi:hypothetical protein
MSCTLKVFFPQDITHVEHHIQPAYRTSCCRAGIKNTETKKGTLGVKDITDKTVNVHDGKSVGNRVFNNGHEIHYKDMLIRYYPSSSLC